MATHTHKHTWSPFPGHMCGRWLLINAPTPASVHSLWSSPPSSWVLSTSLIPAACAPFPTTLPLSSAFDTALCEQPALSGVTFGVLPCWWTASVGVIRTAVESAVFPHHCDHSIFSGVLRESDHFHFLTRSIELFDETGIMMSCKP